MKQLVFLFALMPGVLAGALTAEAQSLSKASKVPTLGCVDLRSPQHDPRGTVAALQDGLRELGYVEGQNIHVEYRFAEGSEERLPALFAELIRLNVDILLTPGSVVTAAAQRATSTIPIIMTAGDPVRSGFVASLARPGGNITGLSLAEDPQFATKRLELLKEATPQVARVGYLRNAANPSSSVEALNGVARSLGIGLLTFEVRGPEQFEGAFAKMLRERIDALITDGDPLTDAEYRRIVAFVTKHHLPGMYPRPSFVTAGGLMSYGTSVYEIWRRVVIYADKILKGAKPADLPLSSPRSSRW
jgi:putative ABC transport system substrate-binding protein